MVPASICPTIKVKFVLYFTIENIILRPAFFRGIMGEKKKKLEWCLGSIGYNTHIQPIQGFGKRNHYIWQFCWSQMYYNSFSHLLYTFHISAGQCLVIGSKVYAILLRQ